MEMPVEKAREEVARFIDTKSSSMIEMNCASCTYCNVVCPTSSNPADLRRDMLSEKARQGGAMCIGLICEEVPANLMTIALEHEKAEKEKHLAKYTDPERSETAFYLGCSLSYLYTDLAHTDLLEGFPKIGGMKYCCGGYVNRNFGEDESRIKGELLLDRLNETGIKKIVTFCPGCDHMLQDVYPTLLDNFEIEVQNIVDYLLERHNAGDLPLHNKLDKKITFHDSCAWRSVNSKIYDGPRALLKCMGAEVVEMEHNRQESMCCGAPLAGKNPDLADVVAAKRILEAKAVGAEIIAVSCTGCFALGKKAAVQNIDVYNITELAQLAIGENPLHRQAEISKQLSMNMMNTFANNPDLLKTRYRIENGQVIKLND